MPKLNSTIWTQTWNQWNTASTITSATRQQMDRWTIQETTNLWTVWTRQMDAQMDRFLDRAELRVDPAFNPQHVEALENAQNARRRLAEEKATAILSEHLEESQKIEFSGPVKQFHVRGKSGRLYRITRGWAGNVYVVDPVDGQLLERLCIHPSAHCPNEDNMLIQKLMIETNEEEFRRIANITPLRRAA